MNQNAQPKGILLACVAAVMLAACAAEVPRQKTQWQAAGGSSAVIELTESVLLEPSTGYTRVLASGSRWREAGRIPEGNVYRPVNGVLTAEGKHVHEAYLVLDGGRVVGFYLPVEQSFMALPPKPINYQNRGN
jgi:hypothetical protein